MSKIEKKRTLISIVLIILLGIISYGNSLDGKFVTDDHRLIKNNVYIKNWSNLPKIFTGNTYEKRSGEKYEFYRPVRLATYMIDYSLWGLNVRGYHFINISLHILVVLAIYWLISILFKDNILSFLTSALFIVHPIHSETVAYISNRADMLVVLFMLLCFIFYIKQLDSKDIGTYILMSASYVLALLSKENSLILPALLLLYHYTFKKKIKIRVIIPVLAITFGYAMLRLSFLKSDSTDIFWANTVFQRIPGFFVAICNYVKLLLVPFNLHMDYGTELFNFTDPGAIVGIILLTSSLLYAAKVRRSNGLIFFSISWFFLTLLPVSNIYPLFSYMAEHFLYLPSIGFFLLLAKGLCYLYKNKEVRILVTIFILGLLTFSSFLTVRQNEYWREPMSTHKRTLEHNPHSKVAIFNLAVIYGRIGRYEEAIEFYKKVIEINPGYAKAYSNLAVLYYETGNKAEAIELYKKAIEIDPNYIKAYNNLGAVYYDMGKKEEAIKLYKKVREINPDSR